jgi:hypothetical protein
LRWKKRRGSQRPTFGGGRNRGAIRVNEANELQSRPVGGKWGDKAQVELGVNEVRRYEVGSGMGHGWGGAAAFPGNERVRVHELG